MFKSFGERKHSRLGGSVGLMGNPLHAVPYPGSTAAPKRGAMAIAEHGLRSAKFAAGCAPESQRIGTWTQNVMAASEKNHAAACTACASGPASATTSSDASCGRDQNGVRTAARIEPREVARRGGVRQLVQRKRREADRRDSEKDDKPERGLEPLARRCSLEEE